MKVFKRAAVILFSICVIGMLLNTPVSAQISFYQQPYFGTTSTTNYGISPFSLGGISPYGINYSYSSLYYPYGYSSLNYPYASGYSPYMGTSGLYPGLGGSMTDYANLMMAMQYYQYLNYAYNFYQIAKVTPMFYMRDFTADYIGSALYSYIQNSGLTQQEGILSFIQQYLF